MEIHREVKTHITLVENADGTKTAKFKVFTESPYIHLGDFELANMKSPQEYAQRIKPALVEFVKSTMGKSFSEES